MSPMIYSRLLLIALAGLSLGACRRPILTSEQAALQISEEPAQITTPRSTLSKKTSPNTSQAAAAHIIQPAVRTATALVAPATLLTPTAPAGTIEMSGFKPFRENLDKIIKVS